MRQNLNIAAFAQLTLCIAILVTLFIQSGISSAPNTSTLYVSAMAKDGIVLIFLQDDVQDGATTQLSKGSKRLLGGDSILLKPGDRIEATRGTVLLTYFDGSIQQLSQHNLTIPTLNPASKTVKFSITDWLTRIITGLNQPFQQSVTVASVLG